MGLFRRRRFLFRFFDGVRKRAIDPLQVYLRLAGDMELAALAERSEQGDREAIEALAERLARIFDVQLYDERTGRGLTLLEVFDLFYRFTDWVELQKKRPHIWPGWLHIAVPNGSEQQDTTKRQSLRSAYTQTVSP